HRLVSHRQDASVPWHPVPRPGVPAARAATHRPDVGYAQVVTLPGQTSVAGSAHWGERPQETGGSIPPGSIPLPSGGGRVSEPTRFAVMSLDTSFPGVHTAHSAGTNPWLLRYRNVASTGAPRHKTIPVVGQS